jgi:hypothetical protein
MFETQPGDRLTRLRFLASRYLQISAKDHHHYRLPALSLLARCVLNILVRIGS